MALVSFTTAHTQTCPTFEEGVALGAVTANSLPEISGMAASTKNPGVLWVHNDKGNPSEVFALDTNGTLLGTYTLGGVTAVDFEDMAIGTVNGVDYLYIADTGDNNARDGKTPVRTTVAIYRVPEPDVSTIPNGTLTGVQTLEVEYPGSAYDCVRLRDFASGSVDWGHRLGDA